MCGIMGYVGKKQAMPIILEGLKKLNYRGYDSAGISTLEDIFHVFKDSGDISDLEQIMPQLPGFLGIGHTRWATHGGVTKENAHPHLSGNGRIAVVHNGVIENYRKLRSSFEAEGSVFRSETDTEVIAFLIEKYYNGNLEEATRKAVTKLKGSYAIAVMCTDEKEKIVTARNGSPLIIGVGDGEYYAASDIPALLDYTNKVIFLDDYEIATLASDQVTIMDLKGRHIEKNPEMISWTSEDVQKAGYPHYMLKEIHEQPFVIRQATQHRISELDGWVYFEELENHEWFFPQLEHITILASGTSFYAGMTGKYAIEQITRIPVSLQLAVEYQPLPMVDDKTLTIAITQSGETADTITAMKKAKAQGSKVLTICNAPGSTASRLSDWTILGNAGPEIGVAATKTFTSQLTLLYLLAIFIGRRKHLLAVNPAMGYLRDLKALSQHLQILLSST
ncbi:MAG: glutamine--fructose-6-phosphate transaminase (isomerizing), partial [Thermoplasmatota archaeon]